MGQEFKTNENKNKISKRAITCLKKQTKNTIPYNIKEATKMKIQKIAPGRLAN